MNHDFTSVLSIDALQKAYSITSSAIAGRFGEMARPSAWAVLRLMVF